MIKPLSPQQYGEKTKHHKSGEYVEGSFNLTYNPYHEKHPTEGIHLQLSSESNTDYSGFADVIEYQGKAWAVSQHTRLDIDYGDEEKEYIGKAVIKLIKDPVNDSHVETSGHYQIR